MGLTLPSVAGFSPPKGIHCFSNRWQGSPVRMLGSLQVSVPRRGFIVFLHVEVVEVEVSDFGGLFQSPEGDSLFFYTA